MYVWNGLKYLGSSEDPKHTLEIAIAQQPAPRKKQPVHVFIHGGSWKNKASILGLYSNVAMASARAGIVGVCLNYRLSPQAQYEEMLQDITAAMLWVKGNIGKYGGNAEAIYLSGHSAGGHLAASYVALQPELQRHCSEELPQVRGLAGLCGVYNVSRLANSPFGSALVDPVFGTSPAVWRQASPVYRARSPLAWTPCLLLNAEDDFHLEADAEELGMAIHSARAVSQKGLWQPTQDEKRFFVATEEEKLQAMRLPESVAAMGAAGAGGSAEGGPGEANGSEGNGPSAASALAAVVAATATSAFRSATASAFAAARGPSGNASSSAARHMEEANRRVAAGLERMSTYSFRGALGDEQTQAQEAAAAAAIATAAAAPPLQAGTATAGAGSAPPSPLQAASAAALAASAAKGNYTAAALSVASSPSQAAAAANPSNSSSTTGASSADSSSGSEPEKSLFSFNIPRIALWREEQTQTVSPTAAKITSFVNSFASKGGMKLATAAVTGKPTAVASPSASTSTLPASSSSSAAATSGMSDKAATAAAAPAAVTVSSQAVASLVPAAVEPAGMVTRTAAAVTEAASGPAGSFVRPLHFTSSSASAASAASKSSAALAASIIDAGDDEVVALREDSTSGSRRVRWLSGEAHDPAGITRGIVENSNHMTLVANIGQPQDATTEALLQWIHHLEGIRLGEQERQRQAKEEQQLQWQQQQEQQSRGRRPMQ